jgi:ribose transport system substrate-binding protein
MIAGITLSVVIAACGSSGSSASHSVSSSGGAATSASVQEAKSLLAQQTAPVTWTAPGPAINVGAGLKGKTLFYIANGLSFPFSQGVVGGVRQAASILGMNVVVTDGAGVSATAGRLVDQAIGRGAAVIIIQGFIPSQLSAPIQRAKAAKIPIVLTAGQDPGAVPADQKALGISAIATFCYSCVGKAIADYVIAKSGDKSNVVVFNVPDIGSSPAELGAFKTEYARLCPGCKSTIKDAPLAQWVSGLPSLTSSTIQADPTVNYLFPLYDGMAALMKPAVRATNAAGRVKIVSYNADKPDLQAIHAGDIEAADVGGNLAWDGFAVVDQAARVLTGAQPVANENVPNRTFDNTVVSQINLSKDEATWYGTVDFVSNYKHLWGVR